MTYSKPPITEAILEVRPKRHFTTQELDKIEKKFASRYPNKQVLYSANIQIQPNKKVESTTEEDGRRLISTDGTDIITLKRASFSISRLAPYCGWEVFFERFRSEFEVVQRITKSSLFSRVGIRFINRIDVPNKNVAIRIEDYLNLSINTPHPDDVIGRYSLQVVFPKIDQECHVIVNSAILPPPLIDKMSFLLDIDVTSDVSALQVDKVWERLEHMRDVKNSAFESFITDKARDLFS